jgi:hypothetical protein
LKSVRHSLTFAGAAAGAPGGAAITSDDAIAAAKAKKQRGIDGLLLEMASNCPRVSPPETRPLKPAVTLWLFPCPPPYPGCLLPRRREKIR